MTRSWWQHPTLGLLALLIYGVGVASIIWGVIDPQRLRGQDFTVVYVLTVLGGAYLLIVWIFPLAMGRAQADTPHRIVQVRGSGLPLASAWCGARLGRVNLRGPLLRVSVHPGGIILQPILLPTRAIPSADLISAEYTGPSFGGLRGGRLTIRHRLPDIRGPVILYIAPEHPLSTAIRSLPVSGRYVADLTFIEHALIAMRADQIPADAVYHVIGDYDQRLDRDDGRTEYVGKWEGRTIVVILEVDGKTIVTVWERKQRRPRRR